MRHPSPEFQISRLAAALSAGVSLLSLIIWGGRLTHLDGLPLTMAPPHLVSCLLGAWALWRGGKSPAVWGILALALLHPLGGASEIPYASSFGFLLLGIGLLGAARNARPLAGACGLSLFLLGYVQLIGHAFGLNLLLLVFPGFQMALTTALALAVLGFGLLASHGPRPLVGVLHQDNTGGDMLRRLLPFTLLGPIFLGWLRLLGEQAGFYPMIVGVAFLVFSMAAISTLLLWLSALHLGKAQDELADLYDHPPCGYLSIDAEDRIVRANETILLWLGYERQALLHRLEFAELLAPESRPTYEAAFSRLCAEGQIRDLALTLERRNGERFPVLLSANAMLDPGGTLIYSRTILIDQSAQRRAEVALSISEAKFRGLLEATPDGLVIVDEAGVIVFANARCESLFGYSPAELVGGSVEKLIPARYRHSHAELQARYLRAPTQRHMGLSGENLTGLHRDGTEFPIEITLNPVGLPEARLVIASIRDISERQQLAQEQARRAVELEQARQSAGMREQLLSTISHEIKTPLSLIMGYAELLQEAHQDDPLLSGLLDGTQRLSEHISRIVDLSAFLSGGVPLYPVELAPDELLEAALGRWQPRCETHGLRLELALGPDLPLTRGDARRLGQLLDELLDNACKFSSPGGAIHLQATRVEAGVQIGVCTAGPAIPERIRASIWEAFQQAESSDASRTGGLGLGLTIAREIAKLHGGRIELMEKEGLSCFHLWLPESLQAD